MAFNKDLIPTNVSSPANGISDSGKMNPFEKLFSLIDGRSSIQYEYLKN
jgi:hypothetical protein